MYFLIFPTIINSCAIKLCYKEITGKGEKKMKHYFFPTVHCAICWTTLLFYINIKLNFHFVLTLVLIVNIIVWVILTITAWKRKQEKLIAIK
jgi:membrane protein DedA with SNARE-associated domain